MNHLNGIDLQVCPMADQITTVKLVLHILRCRRVTVRKLQDEFHLSQSAVYRLIRSISSAMPIRLDDGVVVLDDEVSEPAQPIT